MRLFSPPPPPAPIVGNDEYIILCNFGDCIMSGFKVKEGGPPKSPPPPVAGRTHKPVLNKLCNNGWVLFKIVLLRYLHYVCFWLSMQLKEIGPKFNLNSCVVEKWPNLTMLRFLLVRIISCLSFRSSVRKDDWEINLLISGQLLEWFCQNQACDQDTLQTRIQVQSDCILWQQSRSYCSTWSACYSHIPTYCHSLLRSI